MSSELSTLSAVEAVRQIRNCQISAEDYANALMAQCRNHERLNAFIQFDPEQVLQQARQADHRQSIGKILGPIHGIPIVIKDNFDIAGYVTTAGTPGLKDHRVTRTAPVVQSLLDAGGIILGKTNMHEMAFGATCNNVAFGAVRNPENIGRIAGGSSGGTAAAIAAGMAPVGLGTDTAGSVRVPAALCGLVGLRPTMDSYSRSGIVPLSRTRDTAGPMARNVADLALLHTILDGTRAPILPVKLEGLRVGIRKDYDLEVDADVSTVVDDELRRLQKLGVECVDIEIDDTEDIFVNVARPITVWEAPEEIEAYLRESGANLEFRELVEQIVSPDVSLYFQAMRNSRIDLQAIYRDAINRRVPEICAKYRRYFLDNRLDVLAYPTTPMTAGFVGENQLDDIGGHEVWNGRYLLNTTPITLTGMPGLTLPIGRTAQGLPVGLEMATQAHSDNQLLSIGLAWENSR
ncbi:MAG TPA: indole acetimide hydrolase [Planctomycetes bacterium]|nr:indole acetimide hydrolase [Planctomycetota bacterium]